MPNRAGIRPSTTLPALKHPKGERNARLIFDVVVSRTRTHFTRFANGVIFLDHLVSYAIFISQIQK